MDAVLLVALLGTAYCGGGEIKTTAPRRPGATIRAVSSGLDAETTPVATATVTTATAGAPLPAAVVEPNVIDRGVDVDAVTRSLLRYGRWLEWHHPDPTLVERAYEAGGPLAKLITDQVMTLRRNAWHIVEVDRAPFDLVMVSLTPNVVTFRMTEHLAHREIVGSDGHVIRRDGARTEHYAVSIMRFSSDSAWRLDLVDRRPGTVEVQL